MSSNAYALRLSAGIFLAGAVLTVIFYKLGIKDSATIIALLLVPLLTYGIASGKIIELSAPGGWSAKFQEVARQKVDKAATPIVGDMKELFAVPKADVGALRRIMQTLPNDKPIALILYFGRQGYQQLETVKTYLVELRGADPATVVVLVEYDDSVVADVAPKAGRFVAMAEGGAFSKSIDSQGQNLVDAINAGRVAELRKINAERLSPVFIFSKLTKKSSNAEALREMKQLGVKSMIVVDDLEKPNAIVTREDILAHMFEELNG